jgi:hypothetical protein
MPCPIHYLYCRFDLLHFFASEFTGLGCVRIKTGDRDLYSSVQSLVSSRSAKLMRFTRAVLRTRPMASASDKCVESKTTLSFREKAHCEIACGRQVCKKFSMARKIVPAQGKRLLVYRRGTHSVDVVAFPTARRLFRCTHQRLFQ